jgi:hypothetical protein
MRITDMKSGIGRVYIREALQKAENCFLCYLEDRFEQRYIDNYLSELVMDSGERGKIIESRGFCNYHFYKMFASSTNPGSSDGQGMALILESVTEQLLDDVKSEQQTKSAGSRRPRLHLKRGSYSITVSRLLKTVAHQIKCPACDHVSTMVQIYTCDFLREVIEDEEILKLFDASRGMCIPHYVIASLIASRMAGEGFGPAVERIVDKQIQVLERTETDLAEYIKKQDYHFSQKDRAGTEKTVGESLVRVAGRRGIERTLTMMLRSKESDMS